MDRTIIIERLRNLITSGDTIIGAGCSAGIVAKCAELGGADLIVCYSTGKSRIMGLKTESIWHSNQICRTWNWETTYLSKINKIRII